MSDWPKTITYYLHADDDYNYELAANIGLSDKALERFGYCCYEISVTIEVHEDGSAFITHIEKSPLVEKVCAA